MSDTTLTMPHVNPFNRRGDWYGKIQSFDEALETDFTGDALEELLFAGDSGGGWDGDVSGIAKLKDGRYVAWETTWGPTGDGFNQDAYGGDATIFVAMTLEDVAMKGLTPQGRELCGYPALKKANNQ